MTNTTYRIARNPDADSTSPYLLWVPARFDVAHTEGEGQVAAHCEGHCRRGQWPDDRWVDVLGAAAAFADEEAADLDLGF